MSNLEPFNCETGQIEFYSCKDCFFQTKMSVLFKQHFQEHHSIKTEHHEKFTMRNYVCEKCVFETHFAVTWLQHSLACLTKQEKRTVKNKDIEETNLTQLRYQCQQCPYKTKESFSLKRHTIARHLDESAIKWYQCEKCPYKAK